MFRRVLVPVDFSEKCKRSVIVATDIAGHYDGEIHLLHVIETLVDTDFSELKDFYEKLERKAEKEMKKLLASCVSTQAAIYEKNHIRKQEQRDS